MITFYFAQLYLKCSTVVYMKGNIIGETDKAYKLQLKNYNDLNKVGDIMWLPKAAMSPCKDQPNNWDIARWFQFEADSYNGLVYENSVLCIK